MPSIKELMSSRNSHQSASDDDNHDDISMDKASTGQLGKQWSHKVHVA
jgi:hypothetical protein